MMMNRTYLKNVFWPHVFVGVSFQILDPPQADLRFKTRPRRALKQNPIFEKGSKFLVCQSGAKL
jgi:hypothetical protein